MFLIYGPWMLLISEICHALMLIMVSFCARIFKNSLKIYYHFVCSSLLQLTYKQTLYTSVCSRYVFQERWENLPRLIYTLINIILFNQCFQWNEVLVMVYIVKYKYTLLVDSQICIQLYVYWKLSKSIYVVQSRKEEC